MTQGYAQDWGTPRTFKHPTGGYVADVAESIVRAERDLMGALVGVELDDDERSTIDWLMGWDQPTLHNLAGIIRKSRAAGRPALDAHAPDCKAWNGPHICRLPIDDNFDSRHEGDHRCGGCGDVWNQGPDDYDENFENDYDEMCEDELGITYRTPEPPEVRAAYARAMERAVSTLVDGLEEDAKQGNDEDSGESWRREQTDPARDLAWKILETAYTTDDRITRDAVLTNDFIQQGVHRFELEPDPRGGYTKRTWQITSDEEARPVLRPLDAGTHLETADEARHALRQWLDFSYAAATA